MIDSCPDFSYTPLKDAEIRLLYSDIKNDELIWSLRVVQLTENLEYDALSYTWGDLSHTFPFVCNAQLLHIHKNLNDALPFLARRSSGRPIWIDAVCINQQDTTGEKMRQIRQMDKIYRRATQVWVWLGLPKSDCTGEAISTLPKIASVGKDLKDNPRNWEEEVLPTPSSMGLPSMDSPIWDSISEIMLHNPWYRRLWIVQEAALAQNIMFLFGTHEMQFDLVADAMYGTSEFHSLTEEEWPERMVLDIDAIRQNYRLLSIKKFAASWEQRVRDSSAAAQLIRISFDTCRSFSCYDPKDRVYAVLGFVGEDRIKDANLSLTGNESMVELYTKFSEFLLLDYENVARRDWWKFFGTATTFNKTPGLPSWVPDFHHLSNEYTCFWLGLFAYGFLVQIYDASQGMVSIRKGSVDGELVLRGKIFDEVEEVYDEIPRALIGMDGTAKAGDYLDLREWELLMAERIVGTRRLVSSNDFNTAVSCTGKLPLSEYWRLLIGNNTVGDYTEEPALTVETFQGFRDALERLKVMVGKYDIERDEEYFPIKDDWDKETMNLVLDVTEPMQRFAGQLGILVDRQLFRTVNGNFGFATRGVRPGDLVCVLNGAPIPHVLRRSNNSEELYQLKGEAYVHGMMNGAVDSAKVEEVDIIMV